MFVVEATHKQVHPTTLDVTIDGETIHTTDEHPFLIVLENGVQWTEAKHLNSGDAVLASDGSLGEVESVNVIDEPQTMYNLTVDLVATYLVGEQGWVVHNVDKICNFGEHLIRLNLSESNGIVTLPQPRMSKNSRIPFDKIKMSNNEKAFAYALLSSPNGNSYRLFRTPDGYGLGDFVTVEWRHKSRGLANVYISELKQNSLKIINSNQIDIETVRIALQTLGVSLDNTTQIGRREIRSNLLMGQGDGGYLLSTHFNLNAMNLRSNPTWVTNQFRAILDHLGG